MLKKIALAALFSAPFMTVASARIPLPTCFPCPKGVVAKAAPTAMIPLPTCFPCPKGVAAKAAPTAMIPLPTCFPCGKATAHVASNHA